MKINCGVPGSDRLPPAYRRAANLRTDLGRAVGLYAIGDRSDVVLRTLAQGKAAYDQIGARIPVPLGIKPVEWAGILDALKKRYVLKPFDHTPQAA